MLTETELMGRRIPSRAEAHHPGPSSQVRRDRNVVSNGGVGWFTPCGRCVSVRKMSTQTRSESPPRLIGRGMTVLFVVVTGCFTCWGIAADLTTPMVAGFKRIFVMSTFQASLVQLAYFGAYFLLAIPAAMINEKFGYKAGLLSGLGLAAIGSF